MLEKMNFILGHKMTTSQPHVFQPSNKMGEAEEEIPIRYYIVSPVNSSFVPSSRAEMTSFLNQTELVIFGQIRILFFFEYLYYTDSILFLNPRQPMNTVDTLSQQTGHLPSCFGQCFSLGPLVPQSRVRGKRDKYVHVDWQ